MTPCEEWPGPRFKNGYGSRYLGQGKNVLAHRQAWIDAYGPIPPTLLVMHRCDNRPCVNLEHLQLGTPGDNIRDAAAKGRMASGERHGVRRQLSPDDVRAIRAAPRRYGTGKALAEKHGVSRVTITEVRTGRKYGWVAPT